MGTKTLELLQIYDQLRDPDTVRSKNLVVKRNGRNVYMAKVEVSTKLLGLVTIGTYCVQNAKNARPFMFLTSKQVRILRENHIRLAVKKRKHITNEKTYICFPRRIIIEKISIS